MTGADEECSRLQGGAEGWASGYCPNTCSLARCRKYSLEVSRNSDLSGQNVRFSASC